MATIKVTRTIVVEGDAGWVKLTLEKSLVAPDRPPFKAVSGTITETERREETV